ncbi:hypothetical protein SELMODRAFT_266756 [Selaginella moellendorffii]|uniref:Alpha-mannosidase n=1 Tax=Selaginella moellendorffii TaxID=88036 RepID=D8QZD8_SELML|nr:hypothetical protein SELMODRAFT_266756 [Selaginella moellendorffii]
MAGGRSLLTILVFLAIAELGASKRYNTTAGIVAGKINVHLVPHTHDDVGWLKTVDQYYIGSNNTIQEAGVQYILDSILMYLTSNPDRKFVYVEQAFFQRWWREQTEEVQSVVKELIHSGRLELINGGWCMHDEAATHYIDMIEQTTLGHKYIKEQFGVTPRIGWQIDPFGHSAVQAYLLGAELGFDALFFARIDYQDRRQRYKDKSLEVIWQGSNTLGSDAQVFTSIFPVHYGPPDGHGLAYEESDEIPVQDDPLLFDYNVKERVDAFVAAAQSQANITRTNHIMWTMGNDFKYALAGKWFVQMDKFIHYVNLDGRVNALYSTPSMYLDAKHAADETWPLKTDDFFPYADDGKSFWTGYFTSRAAFKGYVREAARQLEFLAGRKKDGPNTDSLWDALSISQHHDGVSGTEKQHVTNDYAKRLAIGAAESDLVVKSALKALTSSSEENFVKVTFKHDIFSLERLLILQCPLLNVSFCPLTEHAKKNLVVTAYNPLGWQREDYVRIPVNEEGLVVKDASGKAVPSQLVPVSDATKRTRSYYVRANLGVAPGTPPSYWLYFKAAVPPLGVSTYYVSIGSADTATVSKFESSNGSSSIAAGFDTKLTFSSKTGHLTRISNGKSGAETPVQQSYYWYAGYAGSGQHSGAYIFLPDGQTATPVASEVSLKIVRGPLVEEVHQEVAPWIYQIFRLYKDVGHAEVEFVVGPIPVDDGIGKEVITRFTTGIPSEGVFYSDSNGRDFIKRVRDFRSDWKLEVTQPVAGNYYPVNLGVYLTDKKTDFSILVDRSVGAGSISDGQLEVMLHRRLLVDDGRGVGEALDEVVCLPQRNSSNCEGLTVQGISYINVNPVAKAARWRRYEGQKKLFPLQLYFGTTDGENKINGFTPFASGYALPENVGLITLQALDNGDALLRLAHLYEADEDEDLSKTVTVDLSKLFPGRKIKSATELSLSANQEKSNIKPLKWTIAKAGITRKSPRGAALDASKMEVELGCMEIRTIQIHFE